MMTIMMVILMIMLTMAKCEVVLVCDDSGDADGDQMDVITPPPHQPPTLRCEGPESTETARQKLMH